MFVHSSFQLFACLPRCSFARFCVCSWLWCWWGPLGSLGHTLGTPWAPLGTAWAPLATPWAPFGHPWTPPLLREPPRGRHRALPGRHLGPPGHPFGTLWTHLGGHFCHLGNVSPKRSKKTLFWTPFRDPSGDGCICNPSTPAQSKHTLGHYF